MVREARLLWDNPSLCRQDLERLRRLEDGFDPSLEPRARRSPSNDTLPMRRRPSTGASANPVAKSEKGKSPLETGRPSVRPRKKSS